MKEQHESTELLACARAVAAELDVSPADVPIEGYYHETQRLTEYFRLVRALQRVDKEYAPRVSSMREYQPLLSVATAPFFGRPVGDSLLPAGRDLLAQALLENCTGEDVSRWTLDNLVEEAHRVAAESSDFSLVGLACIARDRVMLAALRESAALYAERLTTGGSFISIFVWRVNDELARRSVHFVATFNELFDEDLPEPVAENADVFFEAARENEVIGRCICIGQTRQPRFYHWAIRRGPNGEPTVEEFWDSQLWTTKRYSMREYS